MNSNKLPSKAIIPSVDIAKYIFACLIPFLHIPFSDNFSIYIIRQYIARLGVPLFFCVAGIFLHLSIQKKGPKAACVSYVKRTGTLLIVWLVIYSPLLYVQMKNDLFPIRTLLFKTPAYLWYLSSLVVASIPFALVKKRSIIMFFGGGTIHCRYPHGR